MKLNFESSSWKKIQSTWKKIQSSWKKIEKEKKQTNLKETFL